MISRPTRTNDGRGRNELRTSDKAKAVGGAFDVHRRVAGYRALRLFLTKRRSGKWAVRGQQRLLNRPPTQSPPLRQSGPRPIFLDRLGWWTSTFLSGPFVPLLCAPALRPARLLGCLASPRLLASGHAHPRALAHEPCSSATPIACTSQVPTRWHLLLGTPTR
jgi:hypothetical protein